MDRSYLLPNHTQASLLVVESTSQSPTTTKVTSSVVTTTTSHLPASCPPGDDRPPASRLPAGRLPAGRLSANCIYLLPSLSLLATTLSVFMIPVFACHGCRAFKLRRPSSLVLFIYFFFLRYLHIFQSRLAMGTSLRLSGFDY
jgi:hypothetical protein